MWCKLYQMKKILILLFFIIPFITSAQVKLGLTAGYHFSNIGRYDLTENHSIGNFSIGPIAEYRFNQSPLYLNGQVVYTTFGYGESNLLAADKSGNILGNIDLHRISYIHIPVHLVYGAESKSMLIKGGIGPFVAFQVGDKLKIQGGDIFRGGVASPLYTKGINPVLYGATFQVGIQWTSVVINFHFNQSLNGIYENQSAVGPKRKIAAYGISISYFITKKNKRTGP